MTAIKSDNVVALEIGKIVENLSVLYSNAINFKIDLKTIPSVMLWGAPGVGKSQAVRQLGEKISKKTGKKVAVTDVRLLLFNPIDLRGIPTANADKTLAVWLKPQIFNMDPSPSVVNILFLDEISVAPQSVQAAAYQITLDRVIGEHRLPDNCIVIAAGNRVTDKSVAYKMPKALANRLCHFAVKENFEGWRAWAVKKGINPKVIGFLAFKRDYLNMFDASSDDLAFATPRSWEMVSNVLFACGDDIEKAYPIIQGCLGIGVAIEFKTWCKVFLDLPSIDGIFNGTEYKVPKGVDTLYALCSSIVAHAKKNMDKLDKIANSIRYASMLPPDFSVLILKDYLYIEENAKLKLMNIPEFAKWLRDKGRLLNGIV